MTLVGCSKGLYLAIISYLSKFPRILIHYCDVSLYVYFGSQIKNRSVRENASGLIENFAEYKAVTFSLDHLINMHLKELQSYFSQRRTFSLNRMQMILEVKFQVNAKKPVELTLSMP